MKPFLLLGGVVVCCFDFGYPCQDSFKENGHTPYDWLAKMDDLMMRDVMLLQDWVRGTYNHAQKKTGEPTPTIKQITPGFNTSKPIERKTKLVRPTSLSSSKRLSRHYISKTTTSLVAFCSILSIVWWWWWGQHFFPKTTIVPAPIIRFVSSIVWWWWWWWGRHHRLSKTTGALLTICLILCVALYWQQLTRASNRSTTTSPGSEEK